jgi:hypothetical protein
MKSFNRNCMLDVACTLHLVWDGDFDSASHRSEDKITKVLEDLLPPFSVQKSNKYRMRETLSLPTLRP